MRKLFAVLCITAVLTVVSGIGCKKEEEKPATPATPAAGDDANAGDAAE